MRKHLHKEHADRKNRLLNWSSGQEWDLAKIIIIISLTILTRNEGRLPNGQRNTTTCHGIGRRETGMEWKRFISIEELGGLSHLLLVFLSC